MIRLIHVLISTISESVTVARAVRDPAADRAVQNDDSLLPRPLPPGWCLGRTGRLERCRFVIGFPPSLSFITRCTVTSLSGFDYCTTIGLRHQTYWHQLIASCHYGSTTAFETWILASGFDYGRAKSTYIDLNRQIHRIRLFVSRQFGPTNALRRQAPTLDFDFTWKEAFGWVQTTGSRNIPHCRIESINHLVPSLVLLCYAIRTCPLTASQRCRTLTTNELVYNKE